MATNQSAGRNHTTGEYAIASVQAGVVARTDELHMDSEAFASFYRRSAPGLRAYLARVSGNATLAEDLVQESYLRFLTAAALKGGEVDHRRYLYRIATNLLKDHWRRPRPADIEDVPQIAFAAPDNLSRIDSRIYLDPAMAQMRPRDRQILWLAYAEGYSHDEIAEITGLRSASIRLLLFRARRKMARLLRRQTTVGGQR